MFSRHIKILLFLGFVQDWLIAKIHSSIDLTEKCLCI